MFSRDKGGAEVQRSLDLKSFPLREENVSSALTCTSIYKEKKNVCCLEEKSVFLEVPFLLLILLKDIYISVTQNHSIIRRETAKLCESLSRGNWKT